MSRNAPNRKDELHAEIRRQIGSTGTMRFIRSLPSFEVAQGLPERFVNLLTELDQAESQQRTSRSGS